jgi:hypothetical protein
MKKATLLILIMTLLFLGIDQAIVQAYSPHYLPGGKNYLSTENFVVSGDYLITNENFLVKPYTNYCLTIPRDYYEYGGYEVQITYFENETEVDSLILDVNLEFQFVFGENFFYYTFQTPANVNYLGLAFKSGMEELFPSSILEFQLEEGLTSTATGAATEPYVEGTLIDTNGPYFYGETVVISNFDDPLLTADIKAGIYAYDAISGDLTANIQVVLDEYVGNENVLGEYLIVFAVSDTAENVTQFNCTVKVVDVTNPTMSGPESITVPFPGTKTIDQLKALINASDNHDGDITANIVLKTDDYSAFSAVVGEYDVVFQVTDSSGNNQTYALTILVTDEESPVFTGVSEYTLGYDQVMTISGIQSALTAFDGYDLDVTDLISVKEDHYSSHEHQIGEYIIVFSVTDSNGNIAEKTVLMRIVDEIGPIIYMDSAIIRVYNTQVLTLTDFTTLLCKAGELEEFGKYSVSVLNDSYSAFSSIPGRYHITLDFKDSEGNVTTKALQILVKERPSDYVDIVPDLPQVTDPGFLENYGSLLIGGAFFLLSVLTNFMFVVLKKKHF